MGLDVYLYKCDDYARKQQLEAEYETRAENIWPKDKKYEELTEAEKDQCRAEMKAIGAELGLGEWGEYPEEKKENGLSWYVHALEIVKETIEYVMKQPDQNLYYLHWSG